MTLRDAIAAGADRLEGEDARRDAQLLLLYTLSLSKTDLFTHPERELQSKERMKYEAVIARRASGEPVQYITCQQEFYGLTLKVSPAVLIPRPETELLVDAVLERVPEDKASQILDVGTGSGAIAIALARNLPLAQITAVDLSREALAVARKNASAHGVAPRIRFLESDLFEAVPGETFEAVVSNPPYVAEKDRDSLGAQVREHEPGLALFAGIDGLDVYERLIPQAWTALRPGGYLAMEIGYGQRDALTRLLTGWKDVNFLNDLQGIQRVVVAQRGDL